jgi:ABC-2 type transport system ATP-binding protein
MTSARVLGHGWFGARRAAKRTLAELGLSALAKRPIGSLRKAERHALVVAHARLGDPAALLLDRPFDTLPDSDRPWLRDLIDRAATGRALVVTAPSPAALGVEAEFLAKMHHVVVVRNGAVVASGRPGDVLTASGRCIVRTTRSLGALVDALTARGLLIERRAADERDDAGRLVVELPVGETSAVIVEAALAAEAPLIELLPVGLDVAS